MKKVALLLLLSLSMGTAATDLKIVTCQRSDSPYDRPTTETIYLRGPRQRREFRTESFTAVTITQCDLHRMISLDAKTKTYRVWQLDKHGRPKMPGGPEVTPASRLTRSGKQVTILESVTDTGETKDFFGLKAKHLIKTTKMEPQQTSCSNYGGGEQVDGWYIEAPTGMGCEPTRTGVAVFALSAQGHCLDTLQAKHSGPRITGIAVEQTTTTNGEHAFTRHVEPVEISQQPLDPKLFEIPPDYTEYSAFSAAVHYYWEQLAQAVRRIF